MILLEDDLPAPLKVTPTGLGGWRLLTFQTNGRTIRNVIGGGEGGGLGSFRAAGIFFRYQIPCKNFFRP